MEDGEEEVSSLIKKKGYFKLKEEGRDRSVKDLTLVEVKALSQLRPRKECSVSWWCGSSQWRKTDWEWLKVSAEANICNNAGGRRGDNRVFHSEEPCKLFDCLNSEVTLGFLNPGIKWNRGTSHIEQKSTHNLVGKYEIKGPVRRKDLHRYTNLK